MSEQAQVGQPQRMTIDGQEYRLRPWDYPDANMWGFRLLAMLAKSGTAGFDTGTAGAALAGLNEKAWGEFCALVEKYTDVIGHTEKGEETIVPLSKVSAVHMRGRLATIVDLVDRHIATEFKDFCKRAAGALAAALAQPQGETK